MDPVLMQKFQAIKKSKTSKKQRLLDKFFLYTIVAFTSSVFCSSPFWLPCLYSSAKGFFFISVPKMSSILYSPKLLFLLGNLIVVVLIGESKLFASESSLSGDMYYDEYMDRSRSLRNPSTLETKEKMKTKPSGDEIVKRACQLGSKMAVSVTARPAGEFMEVKKWKNDSRRESELSFPTEDLKKRADDFIARVNRQRRLEARLLLK